MKNFNKIFAVLAWICALAGVKAAAQSAVYIKETFANQRTEADWDMENYDTEIWYISFEGNDFLAALGYDPEEKLIEGGAEKLGKKVVGDHIVQSNPFKVTKKGSLAFSIKVWYACLEESSMRQLLARVKPAAAPESAWDTIWCLRKPGTVLAATKREGIEVYADTVLDSRYNGQDSLIFQLVYYNNFLDNSAFVLAADNIVLCSYAEGAQLLSTVEEAEFQSGAGKNLLFHAKSMGDVAISKVEYEYTLNGTAKDNVTVNFDPALAAYGGSVPFRFPADFSGCKAGEKNKMVFTPVKINGTDAPYNDVTEYEFTYVDENLLTQQFVPMLEVFTSSSCTYCKPMNTVLDELLEKYLPQRKINVVKYQVNIPGRDPYYISNPTDTRLSFYNEFYRGAPTVVFNGTTSVFDLGNDYKSMMEGLEKEIQTVTANKALMSIKMKKLSVNPDTKIMSVDFDIVSSVSTTVQMHAMVTEDTTIGNRGSNGEKQFHYVLMKAQSSGSGFPITIQAGETKNYKFDINLSDTHIEAVRSNYQDLNFVCFLQDRQSKNIIQSASAHIGKPLANEKEELTGVSVYPNPAVKTATVSGVENADIEMFDLSGRSLWKASGVSGNYQFDVSAYRAGTYMIRVIQGNRFSVRKLVIAK